MFQPGPTASSSGEERRPFLADDEDMDDHNPAASGLDRKNGGTYEDVRSHVDAASLQAQITDESGPGEYRVYKRRFFGLVLLILLNIVNYWDALTFAAVSKTAAEFFDVSETAINWLSTAYLFSFVVAAPVTVWILNKHGPKVSIQVASVLLLLGDWTRYAAARGEGKARYGGVMFGQLLIGLAQPFVLSAPTRYSNLWFSDTGRVTATAVTSLANPLGGALGQLIAPFWATEPSEVPQMILYTCIITTVAAVPGFFIPKEPPTPPSAIAAAPKLDLRSAFRQLPKNTTFWCIFVVFGIYVGFFNATATLTNQLLEPYGATETEAGIAGAILIIAGLVSALIISPFVDRSKKHLLTIKILVPVIAASYLTFVFMPGTRTLVGPYLVCAILGASSFALLPCVLEYLVLVTHPVSPEVTSTVCWSGGQLLGAIFVIVEGALKGGWDGEPPKSMLSALIFQAALAVVVVPLPLMIGFWKLKPRR